MARPKERETDRAVVCNLVADVAATMVAKGHEYGDSYLGQINKAIELADPLNDRVLSDGLEMWKRGVERNSPDQAFSGMRRINHSCGIPEP